MKEMRTPYMYVFIVNCLFVYIYLVFLQIVFNGTIVVVVGVISLSLLVILRFKGPNASTHFSDYSIYLDFLTK